MKLGLAGDQWTENQTQGNFEHNRLRFNSGALTQT